MLLPVEALFREAACIGVFATGKQWIVASRLEHRTSFVLSNVSSFADRQAGRSLPCASPLSGCRVRDVSYPNLFVNWRYVAGVS